MRGNFLIKSCMKSSIIDILIDQHIMILRNKVQIHDSNNGVAVCDLECVILYYCVYHPCTQANDALVVVMGANPGGGGGDGGTCPPHVFSGGGHNIKCPPHVFGVG